MGHRFVIMQDDKLYEYTEYEQIPSEFDHVIEFAPEIPPGPHTDQVHEEIDQWQTKFERLREIEYFAPPPYSFALTAVGFVAKKCTDHTPQIAKGSSSVFINGKPAAFVGSSITGCTKVSAGSQTVFIGN